MDAVLFFIAAIGAIAGAVGVVTLRNPFYSVLALVSHLFALAVLFLLLRGAVRRRGADRRLRRRGDGALRVRRRLHRRPGRARPAEDGGGAEVALAIVVGGCLFVELILALLGTGLQALDSEGADLGAGFGPPGEIGKLLLTKFLLPFEVASFLLLVAAVGAVVLARRRGGLEARRADHRRRPVPRARGDGLDARGPRPADRHEPGRTAPTARARPSSRAAPRRAPR